MKETPLAFSVVLHRDLGLALTQLRLLFRPYHAFCLYVDGNTSKDFKEAMHGLVDCYKYETNKLYTSGKNMHEQSIHFIQHTVLLCKKVLSARTTSFLLESIA